MDNKIYVVDEQGKEIEMEIVLTFSNEGLGKEYVLYVNPNEDSGEVYASSYDAEGNLHPIEDEAEWHIVEEVFGAYLDEEENIQA